MVDLEVERIVDSACKEPPKGLSKPMREILAMEDICPQTSDINHLLWEWGAQIEELFEYFPILKDVCKGLKRNQYQRR